MIGPGYFIPLPGMALPNQNPAAASASSTTPTTACKTALGCVAAGDTCTVTKKAGAPTTGVCTAGGAAVMCINLSPGCIFPTSTTLQTAICSVQC